MTTLYISLNLVYCVYCLNAEQWKLILRTEKFRMKYLGYMHQLFCTEWHIYFTLYLFKFFKLLLTVVAVMQHNFIFKLYYRNIEFEKQWMNLYLWKKLFYNYLLMLFDFQPLFLMNNRDLRRQLSREELIWSMMTEQFCRDPWSPWMWQDIPRYDKDIFTFKPLPTLVN